MPQDVVIFGQILNRKFRNVYIYHFALKAVEEKNIACFSGVSCLSRLTHWDHFSIMTFVSLSVCLFICPSKVNVFFLFKQAARVWYYSVYICYQLIKILLRTCQKLVIDWWKIIFVIGWFWLVKYLLLTDQWLVTEYSGDLLVTALVFVIDWPRICYWLVKYLLPTNQSLVTECVGDSLVHCTAPVFVIGWPRICYWLVRDVQ